MRYIIFLGCMLSLSCCDKNKNCNNFKTGVFKYANPKYSEWTVYRADSTQIEINKNTNVEINNSVRWVNQCEYYLSDTHIINDNMKGHKIDTLYVEIFKTLDNRYFCFTKSEEIELELEMIKIREIDQ